MRAAQLVKYGGEAAVEVTADAPKPEVKEGQVLVAVEAAGINPFDVKVREGAVQQMAKLSFPATLGGDFAGTIADLGDEAGGLEIGQAVYGQAGALSGQGSFAEFVPVKISQLAAKPQKLDFTQAAAVPLVSVSAYQALVDHMNLQSGQKILIHGGAGGIGSIAIQLAKHLGAYVATTATGDDIEFVKQLGADEVIDYKAQDFAEQLHDYDAVFDTIGGETNHKSYAILKKGGALVSMVEQPDEALVKQYDVQYTSQFTGVNNERLTKVTELVEDGVLSIHVDKVFPLDQAAAALEYLKTGHPKGKVVLQISQQ